MIEGKVWGYTKQIIVNPFCEMHHVFANKNGTCSKHAHKFKTNLFMVVKGKLLIRVWKNDLVDDVVLSNGDFTQVKPNQYHLFQALEDTEFIELYYPEGIGADIVRETVGYMKAPV